MFLSTKYVMGFNVFKVQLPITTAAAVSARQFGKSDLMVSSQALGQQKAHSEWPHVKNLSSKMLLHSTRNFFPQEGRDGRAAFKGTDCSFLLSLKAPISCFPTTALVRQTLVRAVSSTKVVQIHPQMNDYPGN